MPVLSINYIVHVSVPNFVYFNFDIANADYVVLGDLISFLSNLVMCLIVSLMATVCITNYCSIHRGIMNYEKCYSIRRAVHKYTTMCTEMCVDAFN